jgi:hypothetical protein
VPALRPVGKDVDIESERDDRELACAPDAKFFVNLAPLLRADSDYPVGR